ncbi:MAG: choice-of-anchor D domain-containing protein [Bacteroidota bacterium]|nr:choice-of-anchor D domain-containing protein [Bacteroidota bacterium]
MRRGFLTLILSIPLGIAFLFPPFLHAQPKVVGPLLEIQNDPMHFDTVHCGTVKCKQIVLRNTGDTILTIRSAGTAAPPFSGTLPTGTLLPGQSRAYTFCYTARPTASIDSQRVFFRADSRIPLSIAMCIDVSQSMLVPFGTTTRILAAREAADSLITDILSSPAFPDEIALYRFADTTVLLQDFTDNRDTLIAKLPTDAPGPRTLFFDAVVRCINDVRTRPYAPVVILLTDGQDNGSAARLQDVISLAREGPRPVRIFTIDIGHVAVDVLRQMADSTGGVFQTADDPSSLIFAFQRIVSLVSTNILFSFRMDAVTAEPRISLTPDQLDFGAVTLGASSCLPVRVENNGNAPLDINRITLPSPFTVRTTVPRTIPPGGNDTVMFCYEPRARGFASGEAVIENTSCSDPDIRIRLLGVALPATNSALGPILRIVPDTIDFDTTFCRTTKCRLVTFSNIGDTALTVRSLPGIPPPFTASISVPFELQPGESRTFQVCYTPPDAPRTDTTSVVLYADTRVSLSVGMLFDVSGSMSTTMSDGVQRIVAAKQAGNDFVSGLIDTLNVRDEAAIYAFSDGFSVRQNFTSDKVLLSNAIQALSASGSTRLYNSSIDAVSQLVTRTNKRVLIVLTDGENNVGSATPSDVVAAALAANVTIFTIGIGEANPATLTSIAEQTGGRFFSATSTTDLVAVYRQIAVLLSRNTAVAFHVRGRGVTPIVALQPSQLEFDSTKVGRTTCLPLTVRNIGDAPLTVTGITNGNPMFTVVGTLPLIAPGGAAVIQVCFTPTRLRIIRDTLSVSHNGCTQSDILLPLQGIGYDSVTIALTGEYRGKPGNLTVIPVRLLDKLPAEYEVTSYRVVVSYNKTLLGNDRKSTPPGEQPVLTGSSLSAPLTVTDATETCDASRGYLMLDLAGPPLENPFPDSVLVRLNFRVLLGNARTTDVALMSAVFADGNPRVGVTGTARFTIDSLCYIDRRLLDPSRRITGTLKGNTPNPFGSHTRIAYNLAEGCHVRLSVVDAFGRTVCVLRDEWTVKGDHEILFEARNVPPGIYHCLLECGGAVDMMKMLVVR